MLTSLKRTLKLSTIEPLSLIVSATAGSSKTTTAVACVRQVGLPVSEITETVRVSNSSPNTPEQDSILRWVSAAWGLVPNDVRESGTIQFLAFNKEIATELQSKLGSLGNASTIHSFGSKLIGANFHRIIGSRPRLNTGYKTANLYCEYLAPGTRFSNLSSDQRIILDDLKTIVSRAKDCCLTEQDFGIPEGAILRHGGFYADDSVIDKLETWMAQQNLETESDPSVLIGPFLYILNASLWYPEFDFDDMIYLPNRFGWKSSIPFSLLIVDECQDLSPGKQKLILSQPAAIRIFVGDRNQAIYGFAGADCRAMDNILTTGGCSELPLSWSFRCARKIVNESHKFVPPECIQSTPHAPAGEVLDLYWDKLDLNVFQPRDLVVCRTNAPLIGLAWKLIKAKKVVQFRGRDFGKSIKTLVKKLGHDSTGTWVSPEKFISNLEEWTQTTLTKLQNMNCDTTDRQVTVQDQRDTLVLLCMEHTSLEYMFETIELLFSSESRANAIDLASIHRSKGLEAGRVWWLFPELCPHKMSKTQEAKLQERNLQFVACTRAKVTLGYIHQPVKLPVPLGVTHVKETRKF